MPSLIKIKDGLFYGWVVVIASLIIATITFGTRHSFGVFFKSLQADFGLTRGATSGIFSVYMLLSCVVVFAGGWVLDRYGPRRVTLITGLFMGLSLLLTSQTTSLWQLFVSYSLLLAVGTGPMYTVIGATVSRWFVSKRGLALGIALSGVGLGQVVMTPFAAYLISSLGWRMSYIVMGLIALVIVASLSLLLKKDPAEIGLLPDGIKSNTGKIDIQDKQGDTQPPGLSLLEACRTSQFWLLCLTWLSQGSCVYLVTTHIIPHATDMGISAIKAAVVLSLIGGTNIIGMIAAGRLSDIVGRKVIGITCALLHAAAMIWLVWAHELWMFYLFAVVFGFQFGGLNAVLTAMVGDTFGLRNIGIIMGTLNIAWYMGAAIGPLTGGFIFDVSDGYSTAFILMSGVMVIAALFIALVRQETKTIYD